MWLLAQLGRGDAARRLLRQLEARLSELDAEPEEETEQFAKDIGLSSALWAAPARLMKGQIRRSAVEG